MENKEKEHTEIHNHYEAGANCQVFNGPITGAIFAMPGSTVNQYAHDGNKATADAEGTEDGAEPSGTVEERVKRTIETMKEEGVIKHQYDYTWVMLVMNQENDTPTFKTPQSFLEYLSSLGFTDLPSADSLRKKINETYGKHPKWTFKTSNNNDVGTPETNRRNNVGKRFLSAFRKE